MSVFPQFTGKKRQIVERLLRDESPDEIAEAVKTKIRYVYNVRYELKRRGIILRRPPARRHVTPVLDQSEPRAEQLFEQREQTPTTNPVVATPLDPHAIIQETQTITPDPLAQANAQLEADNSAVRQRIESRLHHQELVAENNHLRELSEDADYRAVIADLCPTIRIFMSDRAIHNEAMRRMLEQGPYKTLLELWVKHYVVRLESYLDRYFEIKCQGYHDNLLTDTKTFFRDYVRDFLNFMGNRKLHEINGEFMWLW